MQNQKRLTGKSDIKFIEQIPGHGFYKMPEPNEGDIHFDIEGFIRPNNRNFEYLHGVYFKENGKGTFKGFSPRWMFPTKLRNVNDAEISTSSILIVLDSAREVELDLVPYFGKQILGDSEIMISETAARHLQVTNDHKDKIEVFFDVISLFNLFSQQSGQSPPEADEDDDKESTKIKEPTTENDDKEGIKAEVEDTNGQK